MHTNSHPFVGNYEMALNQLCSYVISSLVLSTFPKCCFLLIIISFDGPSFSSSISFITNTTPKITVSI